MIGSDMAYNLYSAYGHGRTSAHVVAHPPLPYMISKYIIEWHLPLSNATIVEHFVTLQLTSLP
jgi:hypothetical protein